MVSRWAVNRRVGRAPPEVSLADRGKENAGQSESTSQRRAGDAVRDRGILDGLYVRVDSRRIDKEINNGETFGVDGDGWE